MNLNSRTHEKNNGEEKLRKARKDRKRRKRIGLSGIPRACPGDGSVGGAALSTPGQARWMSRWFHATALADGQDGGQEATREGRGGQAKSLKTGGREMRNESRKANSVCTVFINTDNL